MLTSSCAFLACNPTHPTTTKIKIMRVKLSFARAYTPQLISPNSGHRSWGLAKTKLAATNEEDSSTNRGKMVTSVYVLASLASIITAASGLKKPHILIFLVDDLGYHLVNLGNGTKHQHHDAHNPEMHTPTVSALVQVIQYCNCCLLK